MIENPRSKEEKITKDIRNLLRLKKEIKGVQGITLRDIKNVFEYEKEEEDCYKPVRVNNLPSNNYNKCKSNFDKNRTLSVKEYLNKIRTYLNLP